MNAIKILFFLGVGLVHFINEGNSQSKISKEMREQTRNETRDCTLLTKTGSYNALCFQALRKNGTGLLNTKAEISIAKNGNTGFFIAKLPGTNQYFHGNVILYLDDNSMITLINRKIHWKVNGQLYGQYNLTRDEITKLKSINIRAIRLWICSAPGVTNCDEASEYYNADYFDIFSRSDIRKVDFPKLISDLYNR